MNVQTLDFTKPDIELPKGPNPKIGIYICGTLALLVFLLGTFMAVEAASSLNPDGDAKWVGAASAVLLALINFGLCTTTGLFPEFRKRFGLFSYGVILMELAFMVLSQVSSSVTAGKASARNDAFVQQLQKKADTSFEQVQLAQESAKRLNGLKRGWAPGEAAVQSKLAAQHAKSAASDVQELAKANANTVVISSPLIELLGKTGVFIFYTLLCGTFSIAGVKFTRTMGDLIRKSTGALTPEAQTLALTEKIYKTIHAEKTALARPIAPAEETEPAQQAANDATMKVNFSIRPVDTTAPASAPATAPAVTVPVSTAPATTAPAATATNAGVVMPRWWTKFLVPFGAAGAAGGAGAVEPPMPVQQPIATPPSISAPGQQSAAPRLTKTVTAPDAVQSPAKPDTTAPDAVQSTAAAGTTAPAQVQSTVIAHATAPDAVRSTAPDAVQSAPATETSRASTEVPGTAPTATPDTAPAKVQRKAKQKRVPAPQELPVGDTLSEQAKVKWVYERVRDAVRAEEIKPSTRGLRSVIGCSDPEAGSHIARMAADGTIVFNAEKKQGWKLAPGQSTKQEVKVA